jgi:hypothetical protein
VNCVVDFLNDCEVFLVDDGEHKKDGVDVGGEEIFTNPNPMKWRGQISLVQPHAPLTASARQEYAIPFQENL